MAFAGQGLIEVDRNIERKMGLAGPGYPGWPRISYSGLIGGNRTHVRTLVDVTRRLSGFRDFRSLVENDEPPKVATRETTTSSPAGSRAKNSGTPPAVANATVTDQRVRTRFVMVHTEAGERPGLILEWVKANGVWTARVAYVIDDNATLIVEWLLAENLRPIANS